jgi:hypothetical protein
MPFSLQHRTPSVLDYESVYAMSRVLLPDLTSKSSIQRHTTDLEPKDACRVIEKLITRWSEQDTGNRSGGGDEQDRGQIHTIRYLRAFGWLGDIRYPTRGSDKY